MAPTRLIKKLAEVQFKLLFDLQARFELSQLIDFVRLCWADLAQREIDFREAR